MSGQPDESGEPTHPRFSSEESSKQASHRPQGRARCSAAGITVKRAVGLTEAYRPMSGLPGVGNRGHRKRNGWCRLYLQKSSSSAGSVKGSLTVRASQARAVKQRQRVVAVGFSTTDIGLETPLSSRQAKDMRRVVFLRSKASEATGHARRSRLHGLGNWTTLLACNARNAKTCPVLVENGLMPGSFG